MAKVAKFIQNFLQGDVGLWGQIFLLFLDKHYKNLKYGPRNGQVKPSLGLELKNNGQKWVKKGQQQQYPKNKLKKIRKKLQIILFESYVLPGPGGYGMQALWQTLKLNKFQKW